MAYGGDDEVQLPELTSMCPIPVRRLSWSFRAPHRLAAPPCRLAWLSLQGRLEGADKATSARSVGLSGGLGIAWEGFAPLQRVLLVAVVAAAAADSRRQKEIQRLRRSVEIRDQLLMDMQHKFDDLCEQSYPVEDLLENGCLDSSDSDHDEIKDSKGKRLTDFYNAIDYFDVNSSSELKDDAEHNACTDDILKDKILKDDVYLKPCGDDIFKLNPWSSMEPEERRMSDLSDFGSSVTSSADVQLRVLAKEQESYNFQLQCEEKDAIISKLISDAQAASIAGSKRITGLEEIIKRKRLVITKLKKNVTFLEKKVIRLSRLQRSSFTPTVTLGSLDVPVITRNVLYDMSSSSPSSSDSDTPKIKWDDFCPSKVAQREMVHKSNSVAVEKKKSLTEWNQTHKSREELLKSQSLSSSKERGAAHRQEFESGLRSKNSVSVGVPKNLRRNVHQEKKGTPSQRRWV